MMETIALPEGAKWVRAMVAGFKLHFCPVSLALDLVADLMAREKDSGLMVLEGADAGIVDLPGMIMMDRPIEEIEIDGFFFRIPSQDFEYYIHRLAASPLRRFSSGQEYYKIHGWISCMVMTPAQREATLQKMADMLEDVKRIAADADTEFQRRLDVLNKDKECVISWRDKKRVIRVPEPPKDRN